ncbi:MAG: alpha/beta hydrolase [Candidatus Lokiarchaeota archaeon]|nr:alpha/beta hydrolase [Candidatus Lokiarchaeota archaeon]
MYPWKSAFVKYPDKKIHYYHNEIDSKKSALIFYHGFSDNGLCWDRIGSKFANEYQIYLIDARGHGKSSDPMGDLKYKDLVQDVYDFCDKQHLDDVVLIGHSMGGVVAAMAVTNQNTIRGSVLEDPAFPTNIMNTANLKARQVSSAMHKHRQTPKPKEQYQKKIQRIRPKWDEQDIQGAAEASSQFSLHYPLRNGRVLFSAPRWKQLVPKLTKPVLLLTSSRGLLTCKDGHNFQQLNPLVRWKHFEKVGHNIRREAFSGYYRVVNEFLDSLKI